MIKEKKLIKGIARSYEPPSKNRLKLRLIANVIVEMDVALIAMERKTEH